MCVLVCACVRACVRECVRACVCVRVTIIFRSSPCSQKVDPVFPFPTGHPEPAPATTHASDSLYGPWRAAPNVPGVNNPAVFFWSNGAYVLASTWTVAQLLPATGGVCSNIASSRIMTRTILIFCMYSQCESAREH